MPHPIATVGALVTAPSGKVLIVRTAKWRGAWGVPGGKVEWGETLDAALRREFVEEVGLELSEVEYALVQESIEDEQFHRPVHFLLFNYFAFTRFDAVVPNREIIAWAWVSPQQALAYPLNSFTRRLVEHYLQANIALRYARLIEADQPQVFRSGTPLTP